ncbi:MAG: hypothetical protein GTN43_02170 [Candidatus Aenigmarchaeota archaeon]|nr:hypothetical protein [Candidatus Aenigmarchaeota archaeon]
MRRKPMYVIVQHHGLDGGNKEISRVDASKRITEKTFFKKVNRLMKVWKKAASRLEKGSVKIIGYSYMVLDEAPRPYDSKFNEDYTTETIEIGDFKIELGGNV